MPFCFPQSPVTAEQIKLAAPVAVAASTSDAAVAVEMSPPPAQTPAKKKTVTFKNILETSDDQNAVKRVYNPDRQPTVPIIKISKSFAALSRSQRFALGDIVMPSRLTEVLRNYSANHIDKLNLLTFKSTSAMESDERAGCMDDATATASEASDERIRPDSKSPTSMDATDDASTAVEDMATRLDELAGDDSATSNGAANGNATVNSGIVDRKMPQRSIHSSREIIPNKRYLEQGATTTGKSSGRRSSSSGKKGSGSSSSRSSQPADNFINNTLSSQINNSKLMDDEDEDDAAEKARLKKVTAADCLKPDAGNESESRSESEDNNIGEFAVSLLLAYTGNICTYLLYFR